VVRRTLAAAGRPRRSAGRGGQAPPEGGRL